MGDFRKTPDDPREPLLLRGRVSVYVPHPRSPAGAAGGGNFTCLLPAGSSPGSDAYKTVPGALTPKELGLGDGWWSEWWGHVERGWKASRAQIEEWQERMAYVYAAFELGLTPPYLMEAMAKETNIDVKGLPGAVLDGLSSIANTLLKFTLGGAALGGIAAIEIGGVEGIAPGAALGFEAGLIYLEVTGLADIATYVLMSLGEVSSRLQQGIERAWNAGRNNRPFFDDIKAAGHIMAGGVAVLFRVLLEALLVYLLAKGLGKTLEMIGDSQLGKGTAEWFEKNQNELKSNPKLKPKYKTKGGAGEEVTSPKPSQQVTKQATKKTTDEGPPINRQKQAGHIKDTPQYKNRVKSGKYTSSFDDPAAADQLTSEAWAKGSPVEGHPESREFDFNRKVGTGPNGEPQTKVRVSMDKKGSIHGHTRK
jgi:hypothetical protein